jgi:hypothetical protein
MLYIDITRIKGIENEKRYNEEIHNEREEI